MAGNKKTKNGERPDAPRALAALEDWDPATGREIDIDSPIGAFAAAGDSIKGAYLGHRIVRVQGEPRIVHAFHTSQGVEERWGMAALNYALERIPLGWAVYAERLAERNKRGAFKFKMILGPRILPADHPSIIGRPTAEAPPSTPQFRDDMSDDIPF